MAMIYNSIPYFPTQVSFFEEVAMELIEARYGMKAETAVMKLVCKIYKENGYYMVWNEEQCTLFTNKVGREIAKEEILYFISVCIHKLDYPRLYHLLRHCNLLGKPRRFQQNSPRTSVTDS